MLAENEVFVQQLLAKHAGVAFSSEHAHLLAARLASLAKLRNLASADALVKDLRRSPEGPLLESVIEALTTHETSFFRDSALFNVLSESVLPALVRRRHATRRLVIWSAACSTGQEPYSVALLLRERFPELRRWQMHIWGTDVSRSVIERARDGCYQELEIRRGLSHAARQKYFAPVAGGYRIDEATRGMVTWDVMNLSAPWPPLPQFDLILLRNVLIYFPEHTRASILRRATDRLSKDGFLMLGSSETTFGLSDELVPFGTRGAIYRRREP